MSQEARLREKHVWFPPVIPRSSQNTTWKFFGFGPHAPPHFLQGTPYGFYSSHSWFSSVIPRAPKIPHGNSSGLGHMPPHTFCRVPPMIYTQNRKKRKTLWCPCPPAFPEKNRKKSKFPGSVPRPPFLAPHFPPYVAQRASKRGILGGVNFPGLFPKK